MDLALRQDRRDLRVALAVFSREERSEAKIRYGDMMALVSSLGQCGRKFRREATSRLRAKVSKVCPAPRVTATATQHPRLGMIRGMALDFIATSFRGEPWDLTNPDRRDEAEKLLGEQRPQLSIVSPMCTAFGRDREGQSTFQMVLSSVPMTDRQGSVLSPRTSETSDVLA